jgi:hypothetical protein
LVRNRSKIWKVRPTRRAAVAPGLVALVAVVGAWGLAAPPRPAGPPAGIGEDISLDDGILRVERVGDEEISAMPMAMSGPGMTEPGSRGKEVHVPHGMRRIGIDVVVRAPAGGSGVRVTWRDFGLAVGGGKPLAPVGDDMTRSFIPAGTTLAGNLAFNVPQRARRLELRVRGADRAVSLALGAAPPSAHGGHGHQ